MSHSVVRYLALVGVIAVTAAACSRVDQKKFDPLYRVGKEVDVDVESSGSVRLPKSEELLRRFKTEISLLQGRTGNKDEAAALEAYDNAAAAYKSFLDIRDLDLRGEARDGRMLLGDGWVAIGSRFNFKLEPTPSQEGDKYKFYWVNVREVVTALLAALKNNLAKASDLVNGKS